MKKNYLFLIATFMLNALMFAQTVTLTPTAVNSNNVNSGPINLASVPTSTITLNVKVDIPSNVAVNDQGTITVYYSNLSITNANVATGGNGGNLYFGGGRTATRSMVINLYWSDFLTSGGFIFAEYKTSAGTAYRSSNLAVIKNSTMNSGTTLNPPADAPNPTKIPNSLCCNQTIRLGDKPQPIIGSQFLNPYAREPYGINIKWETNGTPRPPDILSLDNINHSLTLDYATALGSFTVKRSLGYIYGNQYPNTSNSITITVVPSPILRNTISINETPNTEGFIEVSNLRKLTISGSNSVVNLKVLQDPFYTIQNRDPGANVDSYKWEYTPTGPSSLEKWITLPNENSETLIFSDPLQFSSNEDSYFKIRRIAIYQNISQVSNEVKVLVRKLRFNNTICCDQSLKINSQIDFENPSQINGSIPEIDNSNITGTNFTIHSTEFQWQVQSIERSTSSQWTNISGAIYKDYTPNQPLIVTSSGSRGSSYGFQTNY